MPVGNESAGVVVEAGADAQAWVGRCVATQTSEISLRQALAPAVIAAYNKRATGEKYLITPSQGVG